MVPFPAGDVPAQVRTEKAKSHLELQCGSRSQCGSADSTLQTRAGLRRSAAHGCVRWKMSGLWFWA